MQPELPDSTDGDVLERALQTLKNQWSIIAEIRGLVDSLRRRILAAELGCTRLEIIYQQLKEDNNYIIPECTPEKVAVAIIDHVKIGIIGNKVSSLHRDTFRIIAQYLLNIISSVYEDSGVYMLYLNDEDVICIAEALLHGFSEKKLATIITAILLENASKIMTPQPSSSQLQ